MKNFSYQNFTSSSSTETSTFWYELFVYSITLPLFVITTVGNGIILITLKCQARLLSSTSNYFILSLSTADFLVGLFVMPIMSIYTAKKGEWPYGQNFCDLFMAIDFLCSSASFLTLSSMSIERYKMLTTSYVHIKNSSKLRVIIFISLSWLLPFFTWIPVIIIFRGIDNSKQMASRCQFPAEAPYVLCLCVILYHLPLICMVTFYTKLIVHIKSSSLNHLSNQTLHLQENGSSIKRCAPTKLNQNFTLNEPSYHDFIYNQLYSLNRKSINTIAKNCTKYYLNNSPTEVSINNNFLQNAIHNSKKSNSLNKQKLCCFSSSDKQQRKHSSARKNSSANNVININFRKCNLSIPADNVSVSSSSSFEKRAENKGLFNDNLYELDGTIKEPRLKTKRVSYGDLAIRQRNNSKPGFSTLSLKVRSLKIKNRSNSLYYAQNSVEQNFENCESFNYQSLRIKRNRKAARMLGILVAAFTVCWLPFCTIYPLSQFFPELLPGYVTAFIWWLGYLNSAINPFLYVYSNRNIRRSVKNLFLERLFNLFRSNTFRRNSLNQNISRRSFARNNK